MYLRAAVGRRSSGAPTDSHPATNPQMIGCVRPHGAFCPDIRYGPAASIQFRTGTVIYQQPRMHSVVSTAPDPQKAKLMAHSFSSIDC